MPDKEEIQEEYQGAEFDTVDVPEEGKTILADQDEAREVEEKEVKEETKEERQQRKRNDYQKRLNELVRQKHEAEERAAAAEAKAELLEQRRIDIEKKASESTVAILKQREQELIEKRRKAEDDGDMKAYSEASDELFDVRGRMRPQAIEEERKPEQRKASEPAIAPEASAWLEANQWFHDEANAHLAAEVERIEINLRRKGYNLNNPAQAKKLYEEIDRQIRELPEFDSVLGHEEEREEPEKKPAPRSHIAPPSRGGEAPPRQKAGELTEYDKRAMKMVGIDPNDPKARAAYLKRKRA